MMFHVLNLHFLYLLLRPPIPTLFPYTTLFRSTSPTKGWWTGPARSGGGSCWSLRAAEAEGAGAEAARFDACGSPADRKSTRLNSSHPSISYAVFCLKKKNHYLN